jgi:hypothetical protein
MSSTKKPQPKFDFSRVGKKWQEEFSQSAETATRASFTIQRPLRKQRRDEEDDEYSDYVQKFYDDKEAAVDQVKAMGDVQTKLMVQVLADVPREWLLGNAPDVIDWSDVASLDYIQSDYYEELLDVIRSGGARKNAKN